MHRLPVHWVLNVPGYRLAPVGDVIPWAKDASRTLLLVLAAIAASGIILLGVRRVRQGSSAALNATARDVALASAISIVVVLTLLTPAPVDDAREPFFRLVPFEDLRDAINGDRSLLVALSGLLGNVALFLPLGVSLRWRFPGLGVGQAGLVGLATSATIEFLQGLTGGGRWPDTTDVIMNSLGAVVGAVLGGIGAARSHE